MKRGDLIRITDNHAAWSITKNCNIIIMSDEICIFLKQLNLISDTYYHIFHITTKQELEVSSAKVQEL